MLKWLSMAAMAAFAALVLTGPDATAQAQRITIGTNPQGSLYYVVGGGIAKIFSEELERRATTQPYAGSSVYLPLVDSGEVTLGLVSSLDGGRSFRGEGSEPTRNLRTIARLWPLSYAYMTRADSDIRTIQDLEGKRVVVEIRANAALAAANRAMLASGGLSEDDVQSIDIGNLPQGVEGLIEDTLDATAIAVGIPLTRQAHASISGGIRYVELQGEDATDEFLHEQLPGLFS
ncbi:MAG: TAXI family TRAP transporter solute-binding subunit, partial [Hyphomicrobiales bacterium]